MYDLHEHLSVLLAVPLFLSLVGLLVDGVAGHGEVDVVLIHVLWQVLHDGPSLSLATGGRLGAGDAGPVADVGEVLEVVHLPRVEGVHVHQGHGLPDGLPEEHLVDVAGVIRRGDGRLEGGLQLLGLERLPVHPLEPGVPLDLRGSGQALGGLPLQHLVEQ